MAEGDAPAGGGQGDTGNTAPWYGDIPDAEMKGWVENKNFDSPVTALTAYRNLERMVGADKAGRTVVLPGDKAEKPEIDAFFNKLGRPETPDKYEFSLPADADKSFVDWARATFHELGLTGKQAQALFGKYAEFSGGRAQQLTEADQQKFIAEDQALRREWGGAFDQNMSQARAAAKQFGFTAEEIDAIEKHAGYAGVMKRFAAIGAKLGEGGLHLGENPGGGSKLTPGQARARIAELQSDKSWMSMYLSGSKTHLQQMDQLQQQAAARG